MRKLAYLTILAVSSSTTASAQETNVAFSSVAPTDNVQWISETPQRPEDYVGQVFLIQKGSNATVPYFAAVRVPTKVDDEPSVKKSILVKTSKDGSVSFMDFLKLTGRKESVFQFQIVHSKVWSADIHNPGYVKAISEFRNDPATSSIFESKEFVGIVMVTGIVARKIWYKVFSKDQAEAGGNYFLKLGGEEYASTEDYEEVVKYGLLTRPLSGFGVQLPKTVVSSQQVEQVIDGARIPDNSVKAINGAIAKNVEMEVRRAVGF